MRIQITGQAARPITKSWRAPRYIISVGSEETGSLAGHGEVVAGIRNAGGRAESMVVEQGTHGDMIVPVMPVVLDFLVEIAEGSEPEK